MGNNHEKSAASATPRARQSQRSGASTLQLFLLIILASSGLIISSIMFSGKHLEAVDLSRDTEWSTKENLPKPSREPDKLTSKEEKTNIQTETTDGGDGHPFIKQNTKVSDAPRKCLSLNSKEWLEGRRLGNTRQGSITHTMAMDMILNAPSLVDHGPFVSQQTICHEESRFRNWTDDGYEGDKSLHYWALRLTYLAYWTNQHSFAREEAQLRQDNECEKELEDHGVGVFDYECPNAKFLVVPMGEMGLGAVMRLGAANALIAGLASNRTVLLVNNLQHKVSDKALWAPWVHASCPRGDIQCFFMPPTPCTLTVEDIDNGRILVRGEARRLFKFGEIPEGHENDKVIVCNFVLRPKHVPETFRPNLRRIAAGIVHQFRSIHPDDKRGAVMESALDLLMEQEDMEESRPYYYFGAVSKIHHAAVFYSMRPNPYYNKKLDHILSQVVPEKYNPEKSFGLPIRASDKCIMESECLSFPQYMKLMGQIYNKHNELIPRGNDVVNIVLTTESKTILDDMQRFEDNTTLRATVPFPYDFVTNEHDVMQSTGLPSKFLSDTAAHVSEDDVMLSAVSSLKAQLMAKFTIGNCCSNFHLLLFDFLRDGCGAARDNIGQCLQENEDPEFRVCCMWSKTDECKEKSGKRKKAEEAERKKKKKTT